MKSQHQMPLLSNAILEVRVRVRLHLTVYKNHLGPRFTTKGITPFLVLSHMSAKMIHLQHLQLPGPAIIVWVALGSVRFDTLLHLDS